MNIRFETCDRHNAFAYSRGGSRKIMGSAKEKTYEALEAFSRIADTTTTPIRAQEKKHG